MKLLDGMMCRLVAEVAGCGRRKRRGTGAESLDLLVAVLEFKVEPHAPKMDEARLIDLVSSNYRPIDQTSGMKHVDAMSTIGNAAAHPSIEVDTDSVRQFHANLISFLFSEVRA